MTRRALARGLAALLWIGAIVGLLWLGTWQVHRRVWKLDLIARVDARVHAAPVPAPIRATKDDEYRRIVATGKFVAGKDSFVQAVTDRGAGWWVMTPLRTAGGRTVLVDRGYVPRRATYPAPLCPREGGDPALASAFAGEQGRRGIMCRNGLVIVTGLLRLTEPGGGFLRRNDPATDHWYSRDVAAIAARRGLGDVVPYFIDADANTSAPNQPVGGLTVIDFPNNHLVYAITWYTLAVMAAAGFCYWIVLDRRERP
ncbi:SURF1 family protein [Sphingomonas bacterium]|uniref:SURF1 family protein n=1 Tax=Sphingomonas bacterium TaxID=1895847 RepID=UPI0020C68ADE|nr:SURF1 family protein [Sphingomonas bacterium]